MRGERAEIPEPEGERVNCQMRRTRAVLQASDLMVLPLKRSVAVMRPWKHWRAGCLDRQLTAEFGDTSHPMQAGWTV